MSKPALSRDTMFASPIESTSKTAVAYATAVFDVDSIGLANMVSRLNAGFDIGGQPIGNPTAFHIGIAVNPGAPNLDEELRRFKYKVEAGAEFAITQPVFDA